MCDGGVWCGMCGGCVCGCVMWDVCDVCCVGDVCELCDDDDVICNGDV